MTDDAACLATWLRRHHPDDVLMPAVHGEKRPAFVHAARPYTWQDYDRRCAERSRGSRQFDVGILLSDLCCVDVDCIGVAQELERRFPALRAAPCETTTKGAHYYFSRSPRADAHGHYDGARQRNPKVDFKTRCANGTRGFVVVAPSTGKTWVRAPWDVCPHGPAPEVPDDLLDAVARARHPPVRLHVRFLATGETRTIDSPPWLAQAAFAQLFFDVDTWASDATDMPLPDVAASVFDDLAAACETGDVDPVPGETPAIRTARVDAVLRFADYLGVAAPVMARLVAVDAGMRFGQRLLACSERFSAAAGSDRRAAFDLGCGRVDDWASTVVRVDAALAATLEPVHLRGVGDAFLLRRLPRARVAGAILDAEPVAALVAALPAFVATVLRDHPDRLVVAGGAVLGAVVPGIVTGADYDLFVCGVDEAEARDLARDVCERPGVSLRCVTGNAITVVLDDDTVVQLVLRLHATPAHVLHGFDLPPCKVGAYVDGSGRLRIVATRGWTAAVAARAFWVDPGMWSHTSALRIFKYMAKGFDAFVPGLDRARLRAGASGGDLRLLEGAALLLGVEDTLARRHSDAGARITRREVGVVARHLRYTSDYGAVVAALGSIRWVARGLIALGRTWLGMTPARRPCAQAVEVDYDALAWTSHRDGRAVRAAFMPCDMRLGDVVSLGPAAGDAAPRRQGRYGGR